MTERDFREYVALHSKLRDETARIFRLTVSNDCENEAFIDSFEVVDGDEAVVVIWTDVADYEPREERFPMQWYGMTDSEVVAQWRAKKRESETETV